MFEPKPGSWITVMPAYGRDYPNKKLALADWDADMDFVETSTRKPTNKSYCDSQDFKVIIRYKKLTTTLDTTAKRR